MPARLHTVPHYTPLHPTVTQARGRAHGGCPGLSQQIIFGLLHCVITRPPALYLGLLDCRAEIMGRAEVGSPSSGSEGRGPPRLTPSGILHSLIPHPLPLKSTAAGGVPLSCVSLLWSLYLWRSSVTERGGGRRKREARAHALSLSPYNQRAPGR